MRIVSHTCSNTEIVCALGAADQLVAVDADSDYPPAQVQPLPKLGRDLDFDVAAAVALKPDLVLTSLTVPGHERIVSGLREAGLHCLVIDPQSLDEVFASIAQIGAALEVPARAAALVAEMQAAMPPMAAAEPPPVLLEWWPKPVIVPGQRSWASDLIRRAGGRNPWESVDAKSLEVGTEAAVSAAPQAVVMSWCGVREDNYRADVVLQRAGWAAVPAVRKRRVFPISEAYLGRPGPRLVEGYRRLRELISNL